MSDVPRKLSEQELNYLGNKHISPKLLIDAAARLRYLEQRVKEAERLLRHVDAFQEQDVLTQKEVVAERRAFLAEGGRVMGTRREPTDQELAMVDMPSQRDADRAQWRRYAEAALNGNASGWGDSAIHAAHAAEISVAFADAMLAADKAKWEGSHE